MPEQPSEGADIFLKTTNSKTWVVEGSKLSKRHNGTG